MDILLNNPRDASKQSEQAMTFFPSEAAPQLAKEAPVPGVDAAALAREQPKATEAVTIQKHFRGYLTRKWRRDLERPTAPFDPHQHYLRTFESSKLSLPHNADLEAGDRYRLLGMNLPQLLAAAHSDQPASDRANLPSILLHRYSRLDPRLHIPADKLNWKLEESHTNLEFRKKLNKSLRSASKSAQSARVIDLGYSDDFEDHAAVMDSSRKKSAQDSDSYIEDLVHSRSLSASRRQISKRSRGPKQPNKDLNRQSSILDNESSGFGFLQDQKQTNALKSASRVNTEQSEEDSNPFGVVRKEHQPSARKDSDHFQASLEDLTQTPAVRRFAASPRDKPHPTNEFKEHPAPLEADLDFGLHRRQLQPVQLDPKIYSDTLFPEAAPQRDPPTLKPQSQASKQVIEELHRMKTVVSELQELNALYSHAQMGNPHKAVVIKKMAENEALTKRLINKVLFAREQTWDFAQAAHQPGEPDLGLQQLVRDAVREALAELPGLQRTRTDPQPPPRDSAPLTATGRHKPFDELYYRAAGSTARLQAADRQTEDQYLSDLQTRVRKLQQVHEDFNDAAATRKAELDRETQKRDRDRAISRELAARRREFAAKFDLSRFEPRVQRPAEAQSGRPGIGSARSGQVSDYSESKEQIEDISWMESEVSGKKSNKFTVYS